MTAIGIQGPRSIAEDTDVVNTVTIPVTNNRYVAGYAVEIGRVYSGCPGMTAIGIQGPRSIAEDTDVVWFHRCKI